MRDRRIALKVKLKSLAEEARIIRREEQKAKSRGDYRLFFELQDHRRRVLRDEARHAHLAYTLVRYRVGHDVLPDIGCSSIEFLRLSAMCTRFGPVIMDGESREDFNVRYLEFQKLVDMVVTGWQSQLAANRQARDRRYADRGVQRANRPPRKHKTLAEWSSECGKTEEEILRGGFALCEADRESMFQRVCAGLTEAVEAAIKA